MTGLQPCARESVEQTDEKTPPVDHADKNKGMVITTIRATDLALGMRRIPIGFYVVVEHSGFEWHTENKRSSVDNGDVEWRESIPIPSDPSATVVLIVHASFEFQPMLGSGEQLRQLTVTMGDLRNHSEERRPFTFFPEDGDVVSPCSSLLVAITQINEPSALNVLSPHCSNIQWRELEIATDEGHRALSFYRKHGEKRELEHSVEHFERALSLCPVDHPCRAAAQSNMAMARFILSMVNGDVSLDTPLHLYRDALSMRPVGHADRPSTLVHLALVHLARSTGKRDAVDMEQAEKLLQETKDLVSADGHECQAAFRILELNRKVAPVRTQPVIQGGLRDFRAQLVLKCHVQSGNLSDGREISIPGKLVATFLPQDPRYPEKLLGICWTLLRRFQRSGKPDELAKLGDLERAISMLEDAIYLTPDGHPHKILWLNNLSASLRARFVFLSELGDLERAISALQNAIGLTPDNHPAKPLQLNNLGACFNARFEHLGELDDLERAISRLEGAVRLTPADHPLKPTCLNSFGISLSARFRRLGELDDLERAISKLREAVYLTPEGHPAKPGHLDNLGTSYLTRFEHLGDLGDLEQAISWFQVAIDLAPNGHLDRPFYLSSLGVALAARFERLEELRDLDQAISRIADAADMVPDGHPDKPIVLNNLATSFRDSFLHTGELSDLQRAISKQELVINMTPEGHPRKSFWLKNLATSFLARFERVGESDDLERAISLYSQSASYPTGPASVRFLASQQWISCARTSGHESLLHAYSTVVGLLPQLAWIGLSLTNRYGELVQNATVVREAAAAALASGHLETAVEWLEQGRSVVWGELFQLRSFYDELSATYPDFSRKLQALSAELELAGVTRENELSSLSNIAQGVEHRAAASLDRVASRYRALAIYRDKLLQEIRKLPGFERFLLGKEFSQLRTSAHSGPVVILNAAETRCDALIVLSDVENIIHIPFPNLNLERFEILQDSIKDVVRGAHIIHGSERVGKQISAELDDRWESILSSLWKVVVKPVLDSLAFMAPGKQSRIFWCPTGPFTSLPIHAAGIYHPEYSQPGHKVFDFVVSSYVPTLSILSPLSKSDTLSSNQLRFLAVRQPPSDGLSRLPGVDAELKHIRTIITNSPSARITLEESPSGTVEEVLQLMKSADWVHFACHGTHDAANPTESGLCLADCRRLKLSNIIALSRPRGGLAFLSACQTATGDQVLSDEAVHIAAGMLFAGYGGVVGTMWLISDGFAPEVTKGVYSRLFSNDAEPDYREAAQALQYAVQRLRDGGASFSEWVPFIHVGL